jgi:site-specific DNA recombinase
MIAAIYGRKRTDQNIADEEKSVTRQVDRARAYAERKGRTVDPACIFVDDGISGADFVRRDGYVRLMNTLRPRPPFQVLVMMEQSRLGRSLDEAPYALRRISEAGVRIFFYLTDQEVKRDTAVERFQGSVMAFVDEMHREQSRLAHPRRPSAPG